MYYGLDYIIPLELLGIGLFYAILFRLCYALKYDFLRLLGIFCLPFIHFLGFDWLNWGVLTVYGFFDASWRGIICLFLIAYFWYEGYISKHYKLVIIIIIFFTGMQYKDAQFEPLKSDFKLINTNIDESSKFAKENVIKNADFVVSETLKALGENKELIVFPESTFAFELTKGFNGVYYELLKDISNQITIIVGAPYENEGKIYNSAYIFKKGQVQILSKYYLVPFGEQMPQIPYISDFIRQYLLPNLSDFTRGNAFNEYELFGQKITNAICYEVTKEELYKKSKIIIAISNNAWFDNFVEPALQRLLIEFYASKYGVVVYHATNAKETAVITPKKSLFLQIKSKFTSSKPKNKNDKNLSLDKNENNQSLKLLESNLSSQNADFEFKELNASDENSTNENF